MARRRKISEYDRLIPFYKQGVPQEPSEENGWEITRGDPVLYKKIWCHVEVVFREQLEAHVEGININRDRVRVYTRLRDDIDSTMFFKYKNKVYEISIYGEYKGETQLLGESPEDGGS